MDAPWPLWPIVVPTSFLDPLWLHPGGPVWDPFLVHFGDGFGTHFGVHLERLNYPVEEQEGIRKLRRSVSQPGKLPLHASQVRVLYHHPRPHPHPHFHNYHYYGSWTGACGPSWSCRVSHPKDVSFLVLSGALGPGGYGDRLWSRMGGVKHYY